MTLQQAIRFIRERPDLELWLRPMHRGGTGEAYVLQGDRFLIVPTATGGSSVALTVSDVLDTWEVVSSNAVLAERL